MKPNEYPIGTKIKFTANDSMHDYAKADDGKIGTIVSVRGDIVSIYLPKSKKWGYNSKNEITWSTCWENIERINTKGEQLLFSFMDEYYGK